MESKSEVKESAYPSAALAEMCQDSHPQPKIADTRIVIGVDEAGYGPNMGPLLVAATAWRIPKSMRERELAKRLAKRFQVQPWGPNCTHIPLGDSKQLYTPAAGLKSLEAGLLSMLSLLPCWPACHSFPDLLSALDAHPAARWATPQCRPAWYEDLPSALSAHIDRLELQRLSQLAGMYLRDCDIELMRVRALVVLEGDFNQQLARLGSKGRLLSTVTMQLVADMLQHFEEECVEVFCDRQGGRKKYACVLLEAMPDDWFDTLCELPDRSSYRRQRLPELAFHFSVGGDSFAPTALASMTAKYLRERLMAGLNLYWQQHLPDLQPTAGYPNDARRFRAQIESTALGLGHALQQWWRDC